MPDYEQMYYSLFHHVSKTIEALQSVQQQCEELYMEDDGDDRTNTVGFYALHADVVQGTEQDGKRK